MKERTIFVPLADATPASCGGKAAALGAMLRAGLPVPQGFVVPFLAFRRMLTDLDLASMEHDAAQRAIADFPLREDVRACVVRALTDLGQVPVAVRSSAQHEDTRGASAAGQHESFLAVRGTDGVLNALRLCWASAFSDRATAYRRRATCGGAQLPAMAVLIQRHIDAEVSGVMFTPSRPGEATLIEASWGLGPSVVGGTVTPDSFRVGPDGEIACTIAEKTTRLDRSGDRLVTSGVPTNKRRRPALDHRLVRRLAALGRRAAELLGGPQDIEWVVAGRQVWLVQSRPVTAPPESVAPTSRSLDGAVAGTPGSPGTATGPVRVVLGPGDFTRVEPGDVIVCPFTDPAWTPLLDIAAAVVTETGGLLSHAAIVAREHRIPAVLGVARATQAFVDGQRVTVDGNAGTITAHPPPDPSRGKDRGATHGPESS